MILSLAMRHSGAGRLKMSSVDVHLREMLAWGVDRLHMLWVDLYFPVIARCNAGRLDVFSIVDFRFAVQYQVKNSTMRKKSNRMDTAGRFLSSHLDAAGRFPWITTRVEACLKKSKGIPNRKNMVEVYNMEHGGKAPLVGPAQVFDSFVVGFRLMRSLVCRKFLRVEFKNISILCHNWVR